MLRKLDSVVTSLCILQEWAVLKKASDGQLAGHEYTVVKWKQRHMLEMIEIITYYNVNRNE